MFKYSKGYNNLNFILFYSESPQLILSELALMLFKIFLFCCAILLQVYEIRIRGFSIKYGVKGFSKNLVLMSDRGYSLGRDLHITINNNDLAYDFATSSNSQKSVAIMYLPGLIRQKNEAKTINLKSLCKKLGVTFLCADYVGVGKSSGNFIDGSVSRWASDTIELIENLLPKQRKVILVGHGVGTWISIVVAKQRPDLISGIVGMAADPDFTEELLWKKLDETTKLKIMNEGVCNITWGSEIYPISRNLIEDGRNNLLLAGTKNSVDIKCPLRLIHGLKDEEVPFTFALKLAENVKSDDVSVTLLKNSNHALDSEEDFKAMRSMINDVIDTDFGFYDLTSPGSG